jgi:flagellar hook-length control protein FliK
MPVREIFKAAVIEYAESISKASEAGPALKERAELMTKAVKELDGEGKIELITVKKAEARPEKISIEDIFNAMKKTNVNLTSANLATEEAALTKAQPVIVLEEAKPVPKVQNKAEDTVQNTDADVLSFLKTPELSDTTAKTGLSDLTDLTDLPDKISGLPDKTEQSVKIGEQAKKPEDTQNQTDILPLETNAKESAPPVQTEVSVDIEQSAKEISRLISENIKDLPAVSKGGEFEIKMALSPKELGDLLIKVSYSKGSVTMNITTSGKAAEAGVLSRISDLREGLAERGVNLADVKVASGNINYGGESGQNRYSPQTKNNNAKSAAIFGVSPAKEEAAANAETARREIMRSYTRSKRLLYKTI